MKIVTIKNRELKWPNKCAFCNEDSASFAKARRVEGTGYYVVAYTERHTVIDFPVCKKHKYSAKIHNLFSMLGIGGATIFLIFSPIILAIIPMLLIKNTIDTSNMKGPGGIGDIVICTSYGVVWLLSIYFYFGNPVKLKSSRSGELTIKFRNDKFASQFEERNR